MRSVFPWLVLFAVGVSSSANAQCSLDNDVQTYLRSEPGWSPVETKDLISDDRTLWDRHHRGLCPGVAVVDTDGTGDRSYALALLKRENGQLLEKLVVLRRRSGRLAAELLVPPATVMYTNIPSLFVVWRAAPGNYRDRTSGRMTNVVHDSIVYEKMESTATLYYFASGKFSSIVTSN